MTRTCASEPSAPAALNRRDRVPLPLCDRVVTTVLAVEGRTQEARRCGATIEVSAPVDPVEPSARVPIPLRGPARRGRPTTLRTALAKRTQLPRRRLRFLSLKPRTQPRTGASGTGARPAMERTEVNGLGCVPMRRRPGLRSPCRPVEPTHSRSAIRGAGGGVRHESGCGRRARRWQRGRRCRWRG